MHHDFSPFFEKYEQMVREVDAVFERVRAAHPEAVTCGLGCSDCCHALFDLSLVEAMYLNQRFHETFSGMKRSEIMDRAGDADRAAYKFKRQLFKAGEEGKPASEILAEVAAMRLRCPLLNAEDRCELYDFRPITCRLYGIPTAIRGEAHTCGLSGFQQGESYPTVNLEIIQDRLILLSQQLVDSLSTKHVRLAEVLVPVSMALLNQYDKEYLGIVEEQSPCGTCDSTHTWTLGPDGEKEQATVSCAGCKSAGSCDQSVNGGCPDGGPQGLGAPVKE